MAKVHSSRAKIYEKNNPGLDEATEHVESQGERLIKELVLKQIDTQVSLPEELKKTKDFTKATQYVPLTSYTCGQTSLSEFEKCASKATYIEELKSSGLTDEEVELILDHEKGEEFFSAKYKKLESSVLNSWLERTFSKIQNSEKHHHIQKDKQRSSGSISRHEEELGLAVKPDSEHTKLLKFALSCRQFSNNDDPRPPSHPINHLKELDRELFGHLNKKHPESRKSKKSLNLASLPKFKSKESTVNKCVVLNSLKTSDKPATLWDLKDGCSVSTSVSETSTKPSRVYTCKPETLYTIKDKKIVPLNKVPPVSASIGNPSRNASSSGQPFVIPNIKESEIDMLTKEDILKNRMSVEEIKLLPRFQNYEKGPPSQ
ncbi:hypothetical protein L9F63_016625, partial [Diploptera punctata]